MELNAINEIIELAKQAVRIKSRSGKAAKKRAGGKGASTGKPRCNRLRLHWVVI